MEEAGSVGQIKNLLVDNRGITKIELLTSLVLMAVFVIASFPAAAKVRSQAEEKTCIANVHTIAQAIESYYAGKGSYPGSLQDLVKEDYLSNIPNCPVDGKPYCKGEEYHPLRGKHDYYFRHIHSIK